jgi:hypothetical protein
VAVNSPVAVLFDPPVSKHYRLLSSSLILYLRTMPSSARLRRTSRNAAISLFIIVGTILGISFLLLEATVWKTPQEKEPFYNSLPGITFYRTSPQRPAGQAERANALNPAEKRSLVRTGGRHLTDEQIRTIGSQLKRFVSQKFWIISETAEYAPESEQMRFGQQLQQALHSAFWVESRKVLQRMGSDGFKEISMYDYSKVGGRGVLILGAPDSIAAANALDSELRGMGFNSSAEEDDNLKGAILIFIAAE